MMITDFLTCFFIAAGRFLLIYFISFQIPVTIGLAYLLGTITDYLGIECPTASETRDAYLSAFGLSAVTVVLVLTTAVAAFIGYKLGMLLRIICTAAIYEKVC